MRGKARRSARKAQRQEAKDEWDDAVEKWRAAIVEEPHAAGLHFQLGRALEFSGNIAGAILAYRQAIALDPSHAGWHFRLGETLRTAGEWSAARHAFREARRRGGRRKPSLEGRAGEQLPFIEEIELGVVRKPAYAYGLFRAARLAKRLDVDRITTMELGVAGGRGLLALERHARDVGRLFDVRVDVYGLDTGEGLTAPQDHRDLPYQFAEGNYAMDEDKLRSRLKRAELILGDAAQTFGELLSRDLAPIGFISFDMDLYSPTAAVLEQCGDAAEHKRFLPRVACYFDDVVGSHRGQDYNEFTGELLAIREFNEASAGTKIAEDRAFRALPLNFGWHHSCYVMHRFTHPDYDRYVHTASARSLGLS
jgi:tetratricopeptide (TPR) repeat protein